MKKRLKILILILFLVGLVGFFLMYVFGTSICKPVGHVINEGFVTQCKIFFVLRYVLQSVCIVMCIGSLMLYEYYLDGKRNVACNVVVLLLLCVLFSIPLPNYVKQVQDDFYVAKYKVVDKEKTITGFGRGRRVDYYVWFSDNPTPFEYESPISGEMETRSVIHHNKLKTVFSLYENAKIDEDVYVVYFGKMAINVFPVSEYKLEITTDS